MKKQYAIYSSDGKLETVLSTLASVRSYGYVPESVFNVLTSGKLYKGKFFRVYSDTETPLQNIQFPYLCKVDGKTFFKQEEVGKYLGVTKQAISAAHKKHASMIKKHTIEWND